MSVSQAKRTAIEAYRLRNLQKYSAYSLAYYYRKRALIPKEQLKTVGRPKKPPAPAEPIVRRGRGRPRIEKPPKVRNPVGRPKIQRTITLWASSITFSRTCVFNQSSLT